MFGMASGLKGRLGSGLLGGAFSPLKIPGLLLWLRSDMGIYQDAAMTTPAVSDGDPVQGWADQSGNGNNFTQTTAGKVPTLQNGAGDTINGKGVVRFDATDLMVAANFTSVTQGTVFAVVKLTAALALYQTIIGSCDEASSVRRWSLRAYRDGANPQINIYQRDNDLNENIVGNTNIVATTTYIQTFGSTGAAYFARINGTAQVIGVLAGADNGDWIGDTSARDNFSLGAEKYDSEGNFLKGDLAEVIMYSTGLNAVQIAQVENYLAVRWGVTLP